MKTLAERLIYARELRGISQTELATRAGIRQQSIAALESGDTQRTRFLVEIAAVLEVYPKWLLEGTGPRDTVTSTAGAVQVVGYVGAGAQVYPIDDYAQGTGMDTVPKPINYAGNCVAVRVQGDSMHPIRDGWLIYYAKDHDGVPAECLGELCVVKLAGDGPMLVKELRRGRAPGFYRLDSWSAPPIEDVRLEWAARVISISPKNL